MCFKEGYKKYNWDAGVHTRISTIKATTLSFPFARNSKKPSRASFVREQLVGISVSLSSSLSQAPFISFGRLAIH